MVLGKGIKYDKEIAKVKKDGTVSKMWMMHSNNVTELKRSTLCKAISVFDMSQTSYQIILSTNCANTINNNCQKKLIDLPVFYNPSKITK